jgi:amino acid transporter/nucleotide-binding universal stress UspA family protein
MEHDNTLPKALSLLRSERPRNVNWLQAAGLLFGDWGTSRLYVLGLAFLVAGRTSFYLIAGMSGLILAVGWAYTQICRIYPDGGGVYTAARQRSRLLAVIGALLLFADYTVTASLSSLDAFHYFGLGHHAEVQHDTSDAGDHIDLSHHEESAEAEKLFKLSSPGMWAMVAILAIGALNLLGPKHSSGFAVGAAIGMIAITLLVVGFAIPRMNWHEIRLGSPSVLRRAPLDTWQAFVAIVLALSGVEAIANLTGVMHKPVYATARKSIWLVATEVALFNMLLVVAMMAIFPLSRVEHKEDMMAFLARHYVGVWGEWPVRIIAGVLLLSATNTAINGLTSIVYVMSRDGELPAPLQKLNGFGAPLWGTLLATLVPVGVLLLAHDIETLSHLYAIGIVGAVAINCSLCSFHPRLHKWWRKWPMAALGVLLGVIWVTLAFTKIHALIFVCIVLAVGLILRQITRAAGARRPKLSLLRQAIAEQLTPDAFSRPKLLLATAGSARMAEVAIERARRDTATLVVCFVREIDLAFGSNVATTIDTDPAAQALFSEFLALGHAKGVPIIPMYDTGPSAAEMIAEAAAMNAAEGVLIGSSRRGTLHQLIKGSFQRKLEALLPPEIPVEVISIKEEPSPTPEVPSKA